MSATIGNFYERVSRAIRRGNKYDDDIPGYAADAVRELENIENWKYMFLAARGTLLEGTSTYELGRLKSIRYIHLVNRDTSGSLPYSETYTPLRKVERTVMTSRAGGGRPGAFWIHDVTAGQTIVAFDATADQDYIFDIGEYVYSVTPLTNSLEWLTMAEELLIARTIRKMQPILRDDKLVSRWQQIEDSTMPALLERELVSEYDGVDNVVVPFTEEMDELRATSSEF